MAYTLRTKDNPGDVGRAADQQQSVDNDIHFELDHTDLLTPWDPSKPPASPNALDDEFEDSSVAVAWSEYDPDARTTYTEDGAGLLLTMAAGTISFNGIYKSLPAGDFTIWGKFSHYGPATTNDKGIGIGLWEDPTGDNEGFLWMFSRTAAVLNAKALGITFTNRTTTAINKIASTDIGSGGEAIYLRIRRSGTNYYCDVSKDGLCWENMGGALTFIFVPTKLGIGNYANNNGVVNYSRAHFFRYLAADVGLYGVVGGARG